MTLFVYKCVICRRSLMTGQSNEDLNQRIKDHLKTHSRIYVAICLEEEVMHDQIVRRHAMRIMREELIRRGGSVGVFWKITDDGPPGSYKIAVSAYV